MAGANDREIRRELRQQILNFQYIHGKVTLSAPGGYRYFALTGYTGNDSFTLKLCGTNFGGSDGCADLLFSVNVVN